MNNFLHKIDNTIVGEYDKRYKCYNDTHDKYLLSLLVFEVTFVIEELERITYLYLKILMLLNKVRSRLVIFNIESKWLLWYLNIAITQMISWLDIELGTDALDHEDDHQI